MEKLGEFGGTLRFLTSGTHAHCASDRALAKSANSMAAHAIRSVLDKVGMTALRRGAKLASPFRAAEIAEMPLAGRLRALSSRCRGSCPRAPRGTSDVAVSCCRTSDIAASRRIQSAIRRPCRIRYNGNHTVACLNLSSAASAAILSISALPTDGPPRRLARIVKCDQAGSEPEWETASRTNAIFPAALRLEPPIRQRRT